VSRLAAPLRTPAEVWKMLVESWMIAALPERRLEALTISKSSQG
jgi:hypothetical protein